MVHIPLVSVIIPVYNRENVIERSINSVLKQTLKDFELIIVDDCSTDKSCEIVEAYDDERIRLLKCDGNHGANYARNIGIKESKGEYIAFHDSDDEWTPDKLEVQISFMKERNLRASFSPYIILENAKIVPNNYPEYANDIKLVKETLRKTNIIGTPTIIIKREIVEEVGLFDEEMPRLQDYEYVIRVVQKYDIGCCPNILLKVHTDSDRITGDRKRLDVAIKKIIKKHFDFIDLNNFFGIRYVLLNEENEFDYTILQELLEDELFRKFAFEYLRNEVAYQTVRRKKLFSINVARLKNNEFVIYGAGKYAKELYKDLTLHNMKPKFFAVTNPGEEKEFDGVKIVKIDSLTDKNVTIVVAVASKTQNEILELLYKKGFCDVFTI